ncbi:MAG: DUF6190 family protein [Bacteroidota bacterium]
MAKLNRIAIDAELFLKLHAKEEGLRKVAKQFFAAHWKHPLIISYDEIGRIDDVIWNLSADDQAVYFQFMDHFFSNSCCKRVASHGFPISKLPDTISQPAIQFPPELEGFYKASLSVSLPDLEEKESQKELWIPLLSFLDKSGLPNWKMVEKSTLHLKDKSDALMPCMSTGYGESMPYDQWQNMIRFVSSYTEPERLIAGCLGNSIEEMRQKSAFAMRYTSRIAIGVPSQLTDKTEYIDFLSSIDAPFVLYLRPNDPFSISENDLQQMPSIVAVKDSTGFPLPYKNQHVPVYQGLCWLWPQTSWMAGGVFAIGNLESGFCRDLLRGKANAHLPSIIDQYGLLKSNWRHSLEIEATKLLCRTA